MISNKFIGQVMEIKYQALYWQGTEQSKKKLKTKLLKNDKIDGFLTQSICYNKYIWQNTKVKRYKSVISPIISYAKESRAKTKLITKVSKMKASRKICRKKWGYETKMQSG